MRALISKTLSLSLVAGLALCSAAAHGQVWLKATPDRLTTIGDANLDVSVQLAGLRGEFDRRIAVQLDVKADDATRELLAADGLELLAPLGNDGFFARLSADADVAALAQSKMIRGASAIDPSWKIDRKLLGNIYQLYNVTDQAVARDADPLVPVLVMLHADMQADALAVPRIMPHAERIRGGLESIPVFVAEVRQSKIAALAGEDIVQWIAPALPELGELNNENRTLTQAAQLQVAPYNLNGAGVAVLVYDSGNVRTTHQDFQGRATIVDASDLDTVSSHSTHCAGTVGGGGVANATHRGMAPGVQILSAGTGTLSTGWLYSNPIDIEANYTVAVTAGADLATNSIGTNVASNGFDCAWHGDYNVTDVLIDNIVRGSLAATQQRPFRVTWAAGNERGSGRCGTAYGTTAPPSNNKNSMVIGAVDSVSQAMTAFSSWGPSQDGRVRPDFSTGGCQSGGDAGVTSTSSASDVAYASLCGTSMATPTVAGVSALILQDFRAQFPEATTDPRNSFLKALLAHTAVDLGNIGPDYMFGYGSIRARAAIDLMRTGQFLEASVAQGETQTRIITVPAGTTELEVTIAWDDVPGTPNVVPSLVNDVDMTITGPTGTLYRPWSLDPAVPANGATTTGPNRRDNIEQIRIANPPAGEYELDLTGFNIPVGAQAVSVVSSHPISGGSGTPRLVLTAQTLAPAMIAPATPQTVSVTITSRADAIVPGSAVLRYATRAGAPMQSLALTQSGDVWSAQLPGFPCGAEPVYYFEATGQVSGLFTLPASAQNPYSFGIGGRQDRFLDTMQVNQGFTVTNTPINSAAAVSGAWELADPELTQIAEAGGTNLIIQPGDDRTPAPGTLCWVTGAAAGTTAGAFDIDNLTTTLTSPAYNATTYTDPMLSFWRWFNNNGNTTRDDVMTIQLSNDNGGTWQTVETIAVAVTQSRGGWYQSNLRLRDFFATPSANVRFRVTVADAGGASIVEALIDDVTISEPTCLGAPACDDIDFNNNGVFPEDQDVVDLLSVLAGGSCGACNDIDFNNNGVFPEDQDVIDFFNVLAGGQCP